MAFSLKSAKEQAGIEDVVFVKAEQLAKDETVFCIVEVKDVDSQFNPKGQWRLGIRIVDTEMKPHTFFVSFAHDDKRDAIMSLFIEALQTEEVLHSFTLVARQFKKGSRKYYNLEDAREEDGETLVCVCSSIEPSSHEQAEPEQVEPEHTSRKHSKASEVDSLLSEDIKA